jgi:rubredoxin
MNCSKLNSCGKIMMIMDKDMFDFQRADCIRDVCAKCSWFTSHLHGIRDGGHKYEDIPIYTTCPHCGKTLT